jgi:DNA polymerase III subunit epsilon
MGLFRGWGGIWNKRGAESKKLAAESRYVVLDTELTGLDARKDGIVSIGAVRMQGGRIEVGGAFHELVNPSAVLDGRSVVIHGITPSQLETKPPIDVVLAAFTDYVEGAVLVGHCVSIDLAFLNREARRLTGGFFRNPAVDTLSLYGWLRHRNPDNAAFSAALPGLNLFELARLFEIPVAEGHTALGDAYLTAQLFQRFLPLLAEAGIRDLRGLLRVGDPGRQAENLIGPAGHAHF